MNKQKDDKENKRLFNTSSHTTKLIGILNLTPDSFSDGGQYYDEQTILAQTDKLISDGASVIDVGAESTRPGADILSHEQEWHRLDNILPQIIKLCHAHSVLVSLDTYHPQSATKAIKLGVDWINDVTGFNNPDMVATVKESDVKLVVMHSLTVPADKEVIIKGDPIVVIKDWAQKKIAKLAAQGINKNRIIIDPGIGFGKNAEQSWQIINHIEKLKNIGVQLYIGHSRKSFLGEGDRNAATVKISQQLINAGVDYIRVHDILIHKDLIKSTT